MAIIIGFPAIGKSTLTRSTAGNALGLIDLESSCFNIYNHPTGEMQKADYWVTCYVNIAKDLSDQGYNVFVSSHSAVVDQVLHQDPNAIIIVPSVKLKDQWIKRLANRYAEDQSDKNFRALERVAKHFEEDTTTLAKIVESVKFEVTQPVHPVIHKIENIDYDLYEVVKAALDVYNTITSV